MRTLAQFLSQLPSACVGLLDLGVGKALGRYQRWSEGDLQGKLLLHFLRRRRQLGEHIESLSRQGCSFLIGEDSSRALGGNLEEFSGPGKIARRLKQQRHLMRYIGLRGGMEA